MLKETVYPWVISETEPDGITFQQDSATSYTAKLVSGKFQRVLAQESMASQLSRPEPHRLWGLFNVP